MLYEDIQPISRADFRRALDSSVEEHVARAVLAVALHDVDGKWAEEQCLNALKDPRQNIRAAGILGLGHIARIHGSITTSRVCPELEALKSDPTLGGVAEDALEDITLFVSGGPTEH